MSSTYTTNNGLELMSNGDQPSTWGTTLNNNFQSIDSAMDGILNVTLSSSSYTLNTANGSTSSNGRNRVLVFGGTLGSACVVTISPSTVSKFYFVVNNTNQSLVFTIGSGASVTVPAGSIEPLYVTGSAGVGTLTPTVQALTGGLVISNFSVVSATYGNWVVITFGTVVGSRIQVAIGTGAATTGNTVVLPSGFSSSSLLFSCWPQAVNANSSAGLLNFSASVSGVSTLVLTGKDTSNANLAASCTVGWFGIGWVIGY